MDSFVWTGEKDERSSNCRDDSKGKFCMRVADLRQSACERECMRKRVCVRACIFACVRVCAGACDREILHVLIADIDSDLLLFKNGNLIFYIPRLWDNYPTRSART